MRAIFAPKHILLMALYIVVAIGYTSCRKSSDRLEGTPLSEVRLRYTPQVGPTTDYSFLVNLDKKCFINGTWRTEGNERL